MNDDLIVCETTAAIVTHLRSTTVFPPNYGGHVSRPRTLCGAYAAWDTKLPVSAARCTACLIKRLEAQKSNS